MDLLGRLVRRHPRQIVIVVLLLTVFFGYQARSVSVTTNIKDFFPAEHPQVLTYEAVEETFGSAEFIMVAVSAPDIFQQGTLTRIQQITGDLEALAGVTRVRSITNIEEVRGSDWGIEVAALIDNIPTEAEELATLRNRVLADPMYAGSIVSSDGTAALLVTEVDPGADSISVAAAVEDLVGNYRGPETLYVTGTPVLNHVLAKSMVADLRVLFPIVLLLVAAVLFLHFRDLKGVLLPFATVIISVVWTVGTMGILGKQLSPLNAVMPVILVSLGNAYGIYVIDRYRDELGGGLSSSEAVSKTLLSVGVAVTMAGATTVAGFASNITSTITQMRDFGIFTGFGVLVALVISLVFIPALLVLKGDDSRKHRSSGTSERQVCKPGLMDRGLQVVAELVIDKSTVVLVVALGLAMVVALGVPRISTDSNFFNFFHPDSQPRQAYDFVREKFSGSESVEIVIRGDIQDPAVLQAMEHLQDDLELTGLVGKPQSVVNLLSRTNQALNDGDPTMEVLPSGRELVAQYLLLLEMNSEGLLDKFLTINYQEARIQALVKDSSAVGTELLFGHIEEAAAKYFGHLDVEVTKTGIIVLMDTMSKMIIQGQIYSLVFSLVAVFFIVRFLLGSWEGSFLSLLLIALAVLANFGLMGWGKIALDIVTVLISSIGIGVGVDYSIHIYSRYQEGRRRGLGLEVAIKEAVTTTGRAIVCNAGAVVLGFAILLFSSFPPLRYFGSLVTVTMLVASVGSLTILPALVILRGRRRPVAERKEGQEEITS
ncbi:MAG: RND family transporter [Firmicutes bacterium]|nr:RND family transporter [Bacillota bacterium]